MSKRAAIGIAVRDRLKTVTMANGYPVDVRAVYYDDIPMGLELTPEQLPAVFLLDDGAVYGHQHGEVAVAVNYRLQVVDGDKSTDEAMHTIIRCLAKALYADSPAAAVVDRFRALHPGVYQLDLAADETDLHLIEANRIAALRVIVHYRTKPYDL